MAAAAQHMVMGTLQQWLSGVDRGASVDTRATDSLLAITVRYRPLDEARERSRHRGAAAMNGAIQHCGSERRRRRVAEAAIDTGGGVLLNGIDYLEVIDRDAPSDELRQRLIVLTFIRADGVRQGNTPLLAKENFRIEGGTRIRGIEVEKVEPGADPNSLLLTVDRAGDYSPYLLSLQLGRGQSRAAGQHGSPAVGDRLHLQGGVPVALRLRTTRRATTGRATTARPSTISPRITTASAS